MYHEDTVFFQGGWASHQMKYSGNGEYTLFYLGLQVEGWFSSYEEAVEAHKALSECVEKLHAIGGVTLVRTGATVNVYHRDVLMVSISECKEPGVFKIGTMGCGFCISTGEGETGEFIRHLVSLALA